MNIFQKKQQAFVYILLLFSMFFWGTSYVFTSIVLKTLDPISIIFMRLVLSAIMLWLVIAIFFRKEKFPFAALKWVALLAFSEPFIYFIGETYGLQRVSPVITSLIISTIPVFTAIIMRIFFRAKLTWINFAGIFISLSGVGLMIVNKNMSIEIDTLGLLFLVIAVLSAVGYGIILHKVSIGIHPVWLIAAQNSFGVFFFLPLFLLLRETPNFNHETAFIFSNPQWEMWICILVLSIFSSSLAFIFYSISVRKYGISRCTVFTNLIPVFTAITSFFLLGELFSSTKIIGIFVVIFGLILTQRKKE
jgi:drug/metabolite transporter (DMT)-like permease